MKVQWAEKLLQVLFGLLFDPDAVLSLVRRPFFHLVVYFSAAHGVHFLMFQRRVCAGYITSYVSRADYLPVCFGDFRRFSSLSTVVINYLILGQIC